MSVSSREELACLVDKLGAGDSEDGKSGSVTPAVTGSGASSDVEGTVSIMCHAIVSLCVFYYVHFIDQTLSSTQLSYLHTLITPARKPSHFRSSYSDFLFTLI